MTAASRTLDCAKSCDMLHVKPSELAVRDGVQKAVDTSKRTKTLVVPVGSGHQYGKLIRGELEGLQIRVRWTSPRLGWSWLTSELSPTRDTNATLTCVRTRHQTPTAASR